MTSSERLSNGQKTIKPVCLLETKEELINERDLMELNWDESMRERMNQLSMQSIKLFNTPISRL